MTSSEAAFGHRLVPLAAVALAALVAGPSRAQSFAIESAVIDTRSARNLGVTTERGALADLFKAQKAMTFGILRAAGIEIEQLPPEIRARISRFQTTSVDAFRVFSQGLDLKDQGRFAEAKEAFRRASEIDPNFQLAVEQQRAMPELNLGTGVQMRAVVVAAASTAVERGRQGYVVDMSRAVAAMQAGQVVSVTTQAAAQAPEAQAASAQDYTTNPPGSGSQFLPNLVAGLAYSYNASSSTVSIANVNEWTGDKYRTTVDVLESVGAPGDFQAQRRDATNAAGGSATLTDGSKAYWGSWLSTPAASAMVTVSGLPVVAPVLGPTVNYVFGDATTAMPSTGRAEFRPLGGSLQQPSGTISVDFVGQKVGLNNLGFTLNGLVFSGLNGSADYNRAASASGAFQANYTAGSCSGCVAFVPQSSAFGGNFLGKDAAGLVFSTILLTGNSTASGVHLFGR